MAGVRNIVVALKSMLFAVVVCACTPENSVDYGFTKLPASQTGVHFNNRLAENEDFNIVEYLYYYNGGGVATGDINNDGFVDIYFVSNQSSNKLYLNKGNFVFEDITERAGVSGSGNWKTGTTMADVNGDGLLDIFVCGVGNYKKFSGRNQLFINMGDLTFTEQTEEYGLAFQGFSTHSAFFDYDNDGDLDMYLLNHSVHTSRSYGHSRLRHQSDPYAGDKLYRNDLIPEGRNEFTEVTSRSGIYNSQIAYGLGIGISDLNLDGLMDIYVSNDFHENDYLYMNKGDGTFNEEIATSTSHVSRFSMGNDIADVNNDGLPDILTVDMLPRDEAVIKTTAGEEPYDIYEFKLRFGYHHQFGRNMLQLNRGSDGGGRVLFSEVGALAGVEASDWSWAPLLADFDNDGLKDLFISNGIVTRPNDLDYINFISTDSAQRHHDYKTFVRNMPSGEVANLFFKNQDGLRFADVSQTWLGDEPSSSNGAAYADLDNDGDLDLVVNNINRRAFIMRNDVANGHWLQIELQGGDANKFGIGTKVIAYSKGKVFYQEQTPARGWQSSVSHVLHFGIGEIDNLDSVTIIWPDRQFQTLRNVPPDQRIRVSQNRADGVWPYSRNANKTPFLEKESKEMYTHVENNFNAFNSEKLIPHMISAEGPEISVGDINHDGLDDFFIGGAAGRASSVFRQEPSGNFALMSQTALQADSASEDVASAFFDANRDGALDLVVVSGGQQRMGNDRRLRPRLYLNDGSGNFQKATDHLPEIFVDASCVITGDVDGDKDLDMFIGGRVVAGFYGKLPASFLLINEGNGRFTDQSFRLSQMGADAYHPGLVTDASFGDLNEDGRLDIVLVGEWMPVTVLIQRQNATFEDRTSIYGLSHTHGWWNALLTNDFDEDGDLDMVAGNLGLNSRLRASKDKPVKLYVGDIDANGSADHLLTYYNDGEEHPFISRDQLVKQAPALRRDFLKYDAFRNVKREQIIPAADTGMYIVHRAEIFSSLYLENQNGKFVTCELPVEAQMFPILSLLTDDFNGDGKADLLAVGNRFAVQPDFGRYDAGYGLMMLGNGRGRFESVPICRSGFLVHGEGRDIEKIHSGRGNDILVGRNNGGLLLFDKMRQ